MYLWMGVPRIWTSVGRTVTVHPTRGARVGTVHGLWRYPVKSMAGEPLPAADVSWYGLAGDRRWAFVRPGSRRNGFPWHTIREYPAMCRYLPRLTHPARPDKSAVEVVTPTGETMNVTDPALAKEIGADVRVMRLDRGLFDAMPVSLISTASVSALCELARVEPNALRFRPNFVIAPESGSAYAEDDWVGGVLQIGAAMVSIDRRDTRCVIVDVDPRTGRPDAKLLKHLGKHRDALAGVYGTVVQPGQVKVGDAVLIAG
jgi:uncharacterized protein YcbX